MQLPKVEVSAEVPLIKVGDFHLVEKRTGAAAVVHGGYIYTIGGGRGDLLSSSIERFDPRSGKSELIGHLKNCRRDHRAVVIGELIYVIGGYTRIDPETGPTYLTEIIEPATGKVSAGPRLPYGRAFFGCVALGGKIYVLGGSFQKKNFVEYGFTPTGSGNIESVQRTIISGFTNTVISLDPATGRWTDEPPMPTCGETVSVTVSGGWIMVAGGFDGGLVIEVKKPGERFDESLARRRQVIAYDPRTRLWYAQPDLNHSARGHSLAFLGHYLFLFGAKDAEDQLIAYDLISRHAESFTLGYLESFHNAAVVHEDKVYVIGGADSNGNAADYIQVFQLKKAAAG